MIKGIFSRPLLALQGFVDFELLDVYLMSSEHTYFSKTLKDTSGQISQ
nr:hypothetical protein [Vibrio coralliirubri]